MDLSAFLKQQNLNDNYASDAQKWFIPAALNAIAHQDSASDAFIIGINGCQGSGKSTLAALFEYFFSRELGLECVTVSIDDFYFSQAKRLKLASDVHPLLKTRGVPGTHDVDLATTTLHSLKAHNSTPIPRFNKATDNPFPTSEWPMISKAVDVVIFEGWCVGVSAQSTDALKTPVNELEKKEDPYGIWREYVNVQLREEYQCLFSMIDHLILLEAPGFEQVFKWRLEQEQKLIARLQRENKPLDKVMNESAIARFIQHYQRLTEHCLQTLPNRADQVLKLDEKRQIVEHKVKNG